MGSLLSRSLAVASITCTVGCAEVRVDTDTDTDTGICADVAGEDTAPFCLLTSWGSGSVAPEGQWTAEVHIGPGSTGRVVIETGYGTATYAREFDLAEDVLTELRRVHASLDLEGADELEDYPIGGDPVGLAVVVDGAATTYGAWLEDPWEGRKQQIARRTAALVPESLWEELRAVTGRQIRPIRPPPEG